MAEAAKNKERLDTRKVERQKHLAEIEGAEQNSIVRYRLTLDNVGDEELTLVSEFSDEDTTGLRFQKKDEGSAATEKMFPFDIEPGKFETINILRDLIELTTVPRKAKNK